MTRTDTVILDIPAQSTRITSGIISLTANAMTVFNNYRSLFIVLVSLGSGCRESYLPPDVGAQSSLLSSGQYPTRSDLMVVGKTGLDGAPKHWPTPGFSPLLSARFPRSTPDLDIADDIRKQIGKNVSDPTSGLNAIQLQTLAKLLEAAFGIPAEPRVSIPDWDAVALAAVARPDLAKGVFDNVGAFSTALGGWDGDQWYTGDYACNVTVSRGPAMGHKQLSPVPCRATIGKVFSSS
jgi:hypothetical protein